MSYPDEHTVTITSELNAADSHRLARIRARLTNASTPPGVAGVILDPVDVLLLLRILPDAPRPDV